MFSSSLYLSKVSVKFPEKTENHFQAANFPRLSFENLINQSLACFYKRVNRYV